MGVISEKLTSRFRKAKRQFGELSRRQKLALIGSYRPQRVKLHGNELNPKYPPQPVIRCDGYLKKEHTTER
jgi:hypothetical protein